MSKNLNLKKVIKVSYLNYRKSSVFRVFRDSYACECFTYLYILHNLIWPYYNFWFNFLIVLIVLLRSFHPYIFLRFSSVLAFLFFCLRFLICVFSLISPLGFEFLFLFFGGPWFFPWLISLLHRLVRLILWCYYYFTPWEFFTSALADGFPVEFEWQQVSKNSQNSSQYSVRSQQCSSLYSIHLSRPSSPCNNPLVTVTRVPITIGIIVTFMFHSFFKAEILISLFAILSILHCGPPGQQSPQFGKFSFSWLFLGPVVWPRLGHPFVSQNPRGVCASHSSGQILGCAYTICSYGQTSISCTIPSGSPCPPCRA